jgi:hypothetical protein
MIERRRILRDILSYAYPQIADDHAFLNFVFVLSVAKQAACLFPHLGEAALKRRNGPFKILFGGNDGKTLFMTARDSLYSLRVRRAGN